MSRCHILVVASLAFLPACIRPKNDSQLSGVRVGNAKLITCTYSHPHLGGKRVEHYAVYEARKSGLKPWSLSLDEQRDLTNKEKDVLFQNKVLATIRDLDPGYFGLLDDMLRSFDAGENVVYEYANHIGDEEDQEEQISLPKDSFVTDDGKPLKYNPRYDPRPCDTSLLIYRKSKSVGHNTYQVAMDRWDPSLDPESLIPPNEDIKPLDPVLDFLDYRGRAAAKLEDLLDSIEIADPNDVITYVANLLSGTFEGMAYKDYALWKERHGLSTAHYLNKRGHYFGWLQMDTVQFFPETNLVQSGELTQKPHSKYKLSGLDMEFYIGKARHSVDFTFGNAKFAMDQSLTEVWGEIKFDHHEPGPECGLSFGPKAHGTLKLKDRKLIGIQQAYGFETIGCVRSKDLFIRVSYASFDENGQIKSMTIDTPAAGLKDKNYKYEVEIQNKDGNFETFSTGDVLTIENKVVVSSKRRDEKTGTP